MPLRRFPRQTPHRGGATYPVRGIPGCRDYRDAAKRMLAALPTPAWWQRARASVAPTSVGVAGTAAVLLQLSAAHASGRIQLWLAYAGWTAGSAVAVAGTAIAVARRPAGRRRHWIFLLLASVAWFLGQAIWDVLAAVRTLPPPFSAADVLWWLFALFASVALFDVGTARGRWRFGVLEALPLTLGSSAAIVALLYRNVEAAQISPAAKWSTLVYPVAYSCLGVVTLQAVITGGPRLRRDPAFVLVAFALLAQAVAFVLWAPQTLGGVYVAGRGPLDLVWTVGLVALGVAGALAPTRFRRDTRAHDRLGGFLPASCFVAVSAVLIYDELVHADRVARLLLEVALCGVGAALVGRGWLLTRRQSGLLAREAQSAQEMSKLYRNLQSVLCSAGEGIWGLDADGRIAFVNPAAAEMLGYVPEELLSRGSHALTHAPSEEGAEAADDDSPIQQALRDGSASRIEGETFWRKDGTSFPVAYTSTPILEEGRVRGVVVVFRDVTEEVRLETQLRQSQKLEAIGRLSGGVAHDFNNILTAISGYSELIRKQTTDEHVTQWLDGTAVAIERAAALTRQLLAFSRQQVLERHVVGLNEIVAGNEMLLRRVIREDIAFDVELCETAGNIHADSAQLG
jgi:PAS domain S-box-containing protein